jgi:hypothetical protein
VKDSPFRYGQERHGAGEVDMMMFKKKVETNEGVELCWARAKFQDFEVGRPIG